MEQVLHLLADYFIEYYKITENTPYEVIEIDAKKLITPKRIDLAAKYYYIQSRETGQDEEFAVKLYEKHIEAFSDGRMIESGNHKKNSLQAYLNTFHQLIDTIKKEGFDPEISLLPVGRDFELFDGAHRAACAAYFGYKVKVVRFPHLTVSYDAWFFKRRLLDNIYIEFMVKQLCQLCGDLRALCIWPRVCNTKNINWIKKMLDEYGISIIYCKKVKLTFEEFKKGIYYIYRGQRWANNKLTGYLNVEKKAENCYGSGDMVAVFVIQCQNPEKLIKCKEEARVVFAAEKHSMHSTDTAEETKELVDLFYHGYVEEKLKSIRLKEPALKLGRRLRHVYAVMLCFVKRLLGKPV